jgi:rare lipoprotein A
MQRRRLGNLIAAVVALIAAGCVQPPPVARTPSLPVPAPVYKIGEAFQAGPVWHYPREETAYDETGLAVVDPLPVRPRLTDNGEPYDAALMTAAHPTLQMPAVVRVTNLVNGRSVAVRVNDRGPPIPGRSIALTPAAAAALAIAAGEPTPVRVTLLAEESRLVAATARRAPLSGEVAPAAAPRPSVEIVGRAAMPVPERRPLSANPTVPGAVLPDGRFLPDPIVEDRPVARPPQIFVEVGQFDRFVDANRLRAQLSGPWPSDVRQISVGRAPAFSVRLGPLASVAEADGILLYTLDRGQPNARIVVD